MGIELGSIGSAVANAASGIGKAGAEVGKGGPTLEAASSMASLGIGRVMGATDISTPDLGGIFKPAAELAFTKPLVSVKPVEVPQVFQDAFRNEPGYGLDSVKSEAPVNLEPLQEWTIAGPRMIWSLQRGQILEEAVAVAKTAWENHPMTQAEQIVQRLDESAPLVVPVVSDKLEEVLIEEKVEQKRPKESMEEEIETEQRAYLEDEEASAQRRYEIREAVIKARIEADRLGLKRIAGWLVAKFLPGEHSGNRSQVVKKTGPDGSYQETVEEIAGTGELESEEQAVSRFDKVIAEKKPIKYGKTGISVAIKDVARVFKYSLVKPVQPHQEVIKRIVKKTMQQSSQQDSASVLPQTIKLQTESNIKDFPVLAGVLKKAA